MSPRPTLSPRPMREPATLLARPSALAFSRLGWVAAAGVLAVMLPPSISRWCPWWSAPLLAACLVDAGATCALAWGLTGVLLVTVLPPGGTPIAQEVLALAVALGLTRRARDLASATVGAPAIVGATMLIGHDLTLVTLDAASTGAVHLDAPALVVRALLTAVLSVIVVPAWVAWAERERRRGRA